MGEQTVFSEMGLTFTPAVDPVHALLESSALSKATRKRYAGAARSWWAYSTDRGQEPHDADTGTLVKWLELRFRQSPSANEVRMSLAAARMVQQAREGCEAAPYTRSARPALDHACKRLLRYTRDAKVRRADALRADGLVRVVRSARASIVRRAVGPQRAAYFAYRDAALLLVGWWGAFRVDDLVRMDWTHVRVVPQGLEVRMPTSKTGAEVLCALAGQTPREFCPVAALVDLRIFLESNGLFDEHASVFELQRKYMGARIGELCKRAGLRGYFTGHSLRSGFATESAAQGVEDRLVQRHARWKSDKTHALYVREGSLWNDTPTTRVRVGGE
jgi:integrase